MEGSKVKQETVRTVRFRVASANSGRVLAEVFKDETPWCGSVSDPVDSDSGGGPGAQQRVSSAPSEANSHLKGLLGDSSIEEDDGGEPDDLLLYASAKRETLFSNTRLNICSKNGTIRGVRNKVSAGQVLFNNLSKMYSVSRFHIIMGNMVGATMPLGSFKHCIRMAGFTVDFQM
ncbi:glutaredoxin domain-containing cysteine-rich protein 1 [Syngnathus scovelli]|uniref:glutaredoxin domain-containing cysteine-rich protein 1 n=1 Tax=Syngnathus scovelli TaxID=161590 RepID=UPI0035CB3F90